MNTISLTVTKRVINHLASGDFSQRQVAIRHASDQLRSAFATARKDRPIHICLGGYVNLVVGDTGAIWRSHNARNEPAFDLIYKLLALKPEKPMQFTCELAERRHESSLPPDSSINQESEP